MKTISYIFTILVGFTCSLHGTINLRPKTDSGYCLELRGKVLNTNEGIPSDCKIELLMNNQVVDSVLLRKGKHKFSFDLKRDHHYTVRISRPGYLTKTVCIRTHLPTSHTDFFTFIFETSLVEDSDSENVNLRSQHQHLPVAKIYFDERKGCFYYSKTLNQSSQKDLCKVD